jgi:predicted chitinase
MRGLRSDAHDFHPTPDLVNTDSYEVSPLSESGRRQPRRKLLNVYADQINIEMITKIVDGALNGSKPSSPR